MIFFTVVGWISLVSIFSFSLINQPATANQAQVNQVQGILIFTDSKPLQHYEYLGTVKAFRLAGSSQYQPLRDHLVKKLKKDYPAANGAVFHLTSGGTDYADAIKIHE